MMAGQIGALVSATVVDDRLKFLEVATSKGNAWDALWPRLERKIYGYRRGTSVVLASQIIARGASGRGRELFDGCASPLKSPPSAIFQRIVRRSPSMHDCDDETPWCWTSFESSPNRRRTTSKSGSGRGVAPPSCSATIAYNSADVARYDLTTHLRHARPMLDAKAYLHWYEKYGVDEWHFEEAMETIQSVVESYREVTSLLPVERTPRGEREPPPRKPAGGLFVGGR